MLHTLQSIILPLYQLFLSYTINITPHQLNPLLALLPLR